MLAHITAVKALLTPLGWPVYVVEAPSLPTYPYVIVWGSAGQPGIEPGVAGSSDMSDLLGVTVVDTTPENALIAAAAVRAVLDGAHPTVTGRAVWLSLTSSEPVTVDRDVTLPATNRHPGYVVDRYQLISTPA